jgi:hypothetical protein
MFFPWKEIIMLGRWMQIALVGGMLLVGCEKEETTPVTPPPTPSAEGTDLTEPAVPTTAATGPAAGAAAEMGGAAAAAAKSAADTGTAATEQAGAAASDATAAASSQAQTLIDQAMTYVKENKLDLAEQTVTKLEGMKASLSPSLQSAVDNARKTLNAAKGAGALGAPGAPAAPAAPAAPQ